jgi:hypothetical protein
VPVLRVFSDAVGDYGLGVDSRCNAAQQASFSLDRAVASVESKIRQAWCRVVALVECQPTFIPAELG